ncbi:MAG TPA: hypothetical protein VLI06_01500 [Solimonas sp.]|nr:hypothetical protein [Solimonas sp.]
MQLLRSPDAHLMLPCGKARGRQLRLWFRLRFRHGLRCQCQAGQQRFVRGDIRLRVELVPFAGPMLISESAQGDALLRALFDELQAEGRKRPEPLPPWPAQPSRGRTKAKTTPTA